MAEALRRGRLGRRASTRRSGSTPGSCATSRRSWSTEQRAARQLARAEADATRCAAPSRRASPIAGWRRSGARARSEVRALRHAHGVKPVYKRVDTCAAEFEAFTPYLYSTYEDECEARPDDRRKKVMILGGGPNRIGQGIEFDYCCVHAVVRAARSWASRRSWSTRNPETVSHRLRHQRPALLRAAHARGRARDLRAEKRPLGRDRPVRRADAAQPRAGPASAPACRILGTSPRRDRPRRGPRALRRGARKARRCAQPPSGIARSAEEAERVAARIGYPVLVRPVLRARRPRDGDRLRRRRAAQLHARRGRGLARAPRAGRPVPGRRHRGGRRRHQRRPSRS